MTKDMSKPEVQQWPEDAKWAKARELLTDYLMENRVDIAVKADEDDQCFYAWSDDVQEVPPRKGKQAHTAVRNWLDDLAWDLFYRGKEEAE